MVKPHLAHSAACAACVVAESPGAGDTPAAPTQVPHCAAQDTLAVMAGSGAVSATVLASGGPADSAPALLWPRYSWRAGNTAISCHGGTWREQIRVRGRAADNAAVFLLGRPARSVAPLLWHKYSWTQAVEPCYVTVSAIASRAL